MFDLLIRNGRLIDGSGLPWYQADLAISGDRIAAIGTLPGATAHTVIDAQSKVVAPGFVDAHVHGDLALLVDPYHEPAIRQGVTTYVLGQDGVAFAPGSAAVQQYMRQYTAGFNGNSATPGCQWSSVDEYLRQFDRRCALNVCTLIPNGNVRMEVMGLDNRRPTEPELQAMRRMVREGMEQGAVGLSTGLDYIPSIYADVPELVALCEEIAPFDGVYVTHMRGYRPDTMNKAIEEVYAIGRGGNCGVHISHFNVLAEPALKKIDQGRKAGIDVTFDLYCYLYGSTIVAMLTLPPEVQVGGIDATVQRLRNPEIRKLLEPAFANPRFPVDTIRLASIPNDAYRRFEGMLLSEAATQSGQSLIDFVCDLLVATDMAAGCIVRHFHERQESDIRTLMRHPTMMAGSDGIFCGGKPHPRGTGCYARYLGEYVRNGTWTLEDAVMKLAHHPARRHGLRDRGLLRQGMAADVVVFDPSAIQDRSTFTDGKALAEGMQHVIVNGELVLQDGQRTKALPGRGLRRV